ncbi:MAG: multicopper oxidase domain-containing protein [Gemmatimonadaceae bacterium]|nr:multicopper oxidase domain-containing protein [Gemmatimonadaceae bacterium]
MTNVVHSDREFMSGKPVFVGTAWYARTGALILLVAAVGATTSPHLPIQGDDASPLPLVHANDNRIAAGTRTGDTLALNLVVRMADWRPESDSGPSVAVAAFAEEGKEPQIPAPLIRTREGTTIVASVRNALSDSTIGIIGLGSRPSPKRDTLFLRPGETKLIRFAAGAAGTYLYRAVIGMHAPDDPLHEREQAAGALVVDPRAGSPADRIFVINIWGDQKDSATYSNALAINGRSWPWTERLHTTVGDTVRWRVVNASDRPHPMHLHGAYFRVNSKGDAFSDTLYAAARRRLAVTEVLNEERTMLIEWSPVRPGRWLFHCHIAFHVIPSGARLVPSIHDGHDEASSSPLEHMAGLALGIEARRDPRAHEPGRANPRLLNLYVQEGAQRGRSRRALGFVLQEGRSPPAPDSVLIPGSMLVLTRNQPTDVLVHNRIGEATAIHWHGLELESFSDGVSGWSGTGNRMAPAIAPGFTFLAHLSMPRAGTFIYHTHLRDLGQLTAGLYGAIVVLEKGQRFDPRTDHVIISGWDWEWDCCSEKGVHVLVNGDSVASPMIGMRVGEAHRFRFVNISPAGRLDYSLRRDTTLVAWRALAKDGANLPVSQATMQPAKVTVAVGETYDFEFKPTEPGEYTLSAPVGGSGPKKVTWGRRILVH